MKPAVVSLFTLALAACGGSDSSPTEKEVPTPGEETPTANEAQGIYRGMTDTGRRLLAFVLDDGDHAILYGSEGVSEFALSGTILGNATASQGTFTSSGATSISFEERTTTEVSIAADYVTGQYLTGSIQVPGAEAVEFTSSYEDDYDNSPDLAASSDTYMGYYEGFLDSVREGALIVISISEDGRITGSREASPSCSFEGEIKPRATGNLFDVSVSFSRLDCLLSEQTLTGVAYHDGENFRLYIAAPTEDRQGGLFFYGFNEGHMLP